MAIADTARWAAALSITAALTFFASGNPASGGGMAAITTRDVSVATSVSNAK